MGWVGVDLFFVLSGFLVSGLLFKEYLRFGDIKPGKFLIRRGFKIYPIYYLTYLLYLAIVIMKHRFNITGFLSDMFFVQNYVWGWGFAYVPSWSLAVEEHFYFGFALLMFVVIKTKAFKFGALQPNAAVTRFECFIVAVMVLCLFMRIFSNTYDPENVIRHITMTHLRIDSLFAGVLVSYWYYFRKEATFRIVKKQASVLLVIALLLVSFSPFFEFTKSVFVRTFGFTFLFIAFAILLLYFLTESEINKKLDRIFSKTAVDFVAKIGFASYSIYVIHTFYNGLAVAIVTFLNYKPNSAILFVLTSAASIFTGILMTKYLETYFLKIRDKYYPSRVSHKI
ncbi:acyltransferase [Flavobacterium noncentrifugens]|nr:acyltransferase [Flavobacterium noncentrifugens]